MIKFLDGTLTEEQAQAVEGMKRVIKRALISAESCYQESNLATALRYALKQAGEEV